MLGDIFEANKDNLPFEIPSTLNFKLLATILAVIAVAPFLRLIFLLGFVICWLVEEHRFEVRKSVKVGKKTLR